MLGHQKLFRFQVIRNRLYSPVSVRSVSALCLKETVQICFCQNLGKFSPILIIFDR